MTASGPDRREGVTALPHLQVQRSPDTADREAAMGRRMWLVAAMALAVVAAPLPAEAQSGGERVEAAATARAGRGYWMLGLDGQVWAFGEAPYLGQPSDLYGGYPDCSPETTDTFGFCDVAIDLEPTPTGDGYWVLDTTGVIWSHGDARPFRDVGVGYGEPAIGLTGTRTVLGVWVFDTAGCVTESGDAVFHGSMCGRRLNEPVIEGAVTPAGQGYVLLAADGGIFAFGDARFHGSTGAIRLNQPVVGMAYTPSGGGYWLVAADGGIFAFGDAAFYGSMGAVRLNQPVTGILPSPTGRGYHLVAEDGGIFSFGDAAFYGSLGDAPPFWPIVDAAVVP